MHVFISGCVFPVRVDEGLASGTIQCAFLCCVPQRSGILLAIPTVNELKLLVSSHRMLETVLPRGPGHGGWM